MQKSESEKDITQTTKSTRLNYEARRATGRNCTLFVPACSKDAYMSGKVLHLKVGGNC